MTAKNSTRKISGYWGNKDNCANEAKKYATRSLFCQNAGAAYGSALKNGWIEDICPPKINSLFWTFDRCLDVAKSCKTKGELFTKHGPAYGSMCKHGWNKEISELAGLRVVENGAVNWDKDACVALSLVVKNTLRYRQDHKSAWNACVSNGWVDLLLCQRIGVSKYHPVGYWTKERIQVEALKYTHLKDMERGSRAAYSAAKRIGITQEINAHMIWQLRSDHDALYILKTDQQIEGLTVYKCGVTSWRLGTNRFKVLGMASGFRYTTLFHKRVNGNAVPTEQAILSIGRGSLYEGFDGCTEHRQWTDGELENAMMLASDAVMQFNDVKRDAPQPLTQQLGLWG